MELKEACKIADELQSSLRLQSHTGSGDEADAIVVLLSDRRRLQDELAHVDTVLARRDALDDCATRIDKILKCISVAAQVDGYKIEREKIPITANGVLIYPQMPVWWDGPGGRGNGQVHHISPICCEVYDYALDAEVPIPFSELYSTKQAAVEADITIMERDQSGKVVYNHKLDDDYHIERIGK